MGIIAKTLRGMVFMLSDSEIKIGILNIMHNKVETKNNFENVFNNYNLNPNLIYYYPTSKYANQSVPKEVREHARPLDFTEIKELDAFIITGAPLDGISFQEVTYYPEIEALIDFLNKYQITQLYICWGAMAALHHLYGIQKSPFEQKLFGVYPHLINQQSPLLRGLKKGFKAPHARYAEMNLSQISKISDLSIPVETKNKQDFLIENEQQNQTFLFAHLEYEKNDLYHEYEREIKAAVNPTKQIMKPENDPISDNFNFAWKHTRFVFFHNWIMEIFKNMKQRETL